MNKKELLNYLLENNTNISIEEIIIGLIMAVIMAAFIYVVYKKTYSGVMYSKNFNITLMAICIITTMVMMIIGSNLALSLGMVGALSIIRFRTAVKDTKDSAYIFWAIAAGIACGTGIYSIAVIGSVLIALVMIFMSKGIMDEDTYLLIIHGDNELSMEDTASAVQSNTKKMNLKMKNITETKIDITYEVSFGKNKDTELVGAIQKLKGIKAVNVVTYNGEIAG